MLRLYSYKENPRVHKILITAEYVGVKMEQPKFEMGKDNITADFLQMNPTGQVPLLETEHGLVFESNAIAKYIASLNPAKGLLGQNNLEAAQVDQWLEYCTNEIEPSVMTWIAPILGYFPFNADLNKQAQANIKTAMTALDRYLERHQFLVGERLTLADIVVASTLLPLYQRVLEPRLRTPFNNVNRWFELTTQQEKFSSVLNLSPTTWCTVAQKPTKFEQKEKKEEKKEKEEKPKKEQKPKEEKPQKKQQKKEAEEEGEGGEAKEEKPKAEKKKKKEAEEAEEGEEEEDEVKEEKVVNPLDALPKSPFPLDQFKREYSNKPVPESSQYLWDNFDPQGYCMMWTKYKYNEECTVPFRTANLVGGFYQRLEKMHKYAFGVMLIHGEETKQEISGYWIFRGQGLPESMNDVPDTELYDWTLIDWTTIDEHKERIVKYLAWEEVDGKPCLDGKTFK